MRNVISVSCGIGRSLEEAAKAVKKAKVYKGKREFNVEVYKGKRLRGKIPEVLKERINNYLKLSSKLSDEQKKLLNSFALQDSITGLLNKTGFILRLVQLQKMGITNGYYLLFDMDNLHGWNKKLGYTKVDKAIEIAGKEILTNIRRDKERAADVLGHRLHESAGDEFLVFFPSKHTKENLKIFEERAEKILENIKKRQIEN